VKTAVLRGNTRRIPGTNRMNRLLPYAGASDCTWFSTARVFGKLYMQCFDQLLACVLRLRLRFSLLLVAIEKGRRVKYY
jgi:hypothetical protein